MADSESVLNAFESICTECGAQGLHAKYSGAIPSFAEDFPYFVCNQCHSVFNGHNSTGYTKDDLGDVCQRILSKGSIKIGCYIFGPASPGRDAAFKYEFDKRSQLRDHFKKQSLLSELIKWVRFPEEDMPTRGRSPSGPLTRQEIRLVERARAQGICPILFFLIYSPGTIAELEVAVAFANCSLVFIRESFRGSLVGQDRVVDLRTKGADVFFYASSDGCHLKAFAEDYLRERVEYTFSLLDALDHASEGLAQLGIKARRRISE